MVHITMSKRLRTILFVSILILSLAIAEQFEITSYENATQTSNCGVISTHKNIHNVKYLEKTQTQKLPVGFEHNVTVKVK